MKKITFKQLFEFLDEDTKIEITDEEYERMQRVYYSKIGVYEKHDVSSIYIKNLEEILLDSIMKKHAYMYLNRQIDKMCNRLFKDIMNSK